MLDKLPKTVQSEIYQFLEGKEVLRMEAVSKRSSAGARQDFIWRYLTENSLNLVKSKLFNETWKRTFWRNFAAGKHVTPEKFNY